MKDHIVNVRMSRELVDQMFVRIANGDRVTIEFGEPDADGFHEPVFTADHGDNNVVAALVALRTGVEAIKHPCHDVCSGDLHADCQCAAFVRESVLALIDRASS